MGHKATSAPYNACLTAVTPKKNPWICGFGENPSEVAQQIDFDDMSPLHITQSAIFLHRALAWRKVRMAAAR